MFGLKRKGKNVKIFPLAKIVDPSTVSVGDSVIIDDFVFIGTGDVEIGSFVHIGSHTSIAGGGSFIMEDFAGLSGGVRVYTGNEDYLGGSLTNPAVPSPYRIPERSFIRMCKHSIVGANAVILPGVTIGEGAVVGSNALVTRDCEPWTINVGSPAKPIKERPREKMLQLEKELRETLFKDGEYIGG